MKKYIFIIIVLSLTIIPTSCNRWLDVTPPSQVREEKQFNSADGFQQALIGCYIGMTDDVLYGKALTWSTIELMAGQFEGLQPLTSNDYNISQFNYKTTNALNYIDGIWAKAYNVISNANNALKFIELNRTVLDEINYKLIKGELLAIRAYMHLDLLRLYGNGNLANRTDLDSKQTIPYVTELKKEMTAQRSYKETFELLINDLKEAITLLEEDPVTRLRPET